MEDKKVNVHSHRVPEPIIYFANSESDISNGKRHLAEISFQGKIKIFDYVPDFDSVEYSKPNNPEAFVITQLITLELIEDADPYTLGVLVKQTYQKLKAHMDKYIAK